MPVEVRLTRGKEVFDEIVKKAKYTKHSCFYKFAERDHIIWNCILLSDALRDDNPVLSGEIEECMKEYMHGEFEIPKVNLSCATDVYNGIPKVRICRAYRPNIIEIIHGKIFKDYHNDTLWKGFQSSVYMQSAHVQNMCLILMTEVAKDDRYNNAHVRSLCSQLRGTLNVIASREANRKTVSEEHLEMWDNISYKYIKELKPMSDKAMNMYYEFYKNSGHPDAFISSLCKVIALFGGVYKSSQEYNVKSLRIKYEQDASEYLKEFEDMSVLALRIMKACNKAVSVKNLHDTILEPENLSEMVLEINNFVCNEDLWLRICEDI